MQLGARLSLALVAPFATLLLICFLFPIGAAVLRGVQDPEIVDAFPRTAQALREWSGSGLPEPSVARTLIEEIQAARGKPIMAAAASRLNSDVNGFRALLMRTARRREINQDDPYQALTTIDPRWSEPQYWAAIKRAIGPYTTYHVANALDLRRAAAGGFEFVPENRAIFGRILLRTFQIAVVVSLLCLVLGYPVAYLIASAPAGYANWLLLLVLLPFWTSVLVRTTGWLVLLQKNGLVNDALLALGVLSEPLALVYNRTGVYIAMTHVLLPLMVLPIYSVMKGIGPETMRAARSLGAPSWLAFRRVYIPQTRAGIAAGLTLVFVSALGFYITPALVGGADDQMVSFFIAFYTNQSPSYGMVGALSLLVLLVAAAAYLVLGKVEGADPAGGR